MRFASKINEAFPGVLGKGEIRPFVSREQGNKSLKLKEAGEQMRIWGTGNIENQDFDFGSKGKCRFFQRNRGTGTPSPPGRASSIFRNVQAHLIHLISKRVTAQYVSVGWKAYWCTPSPPPAPHPYPRRFFFLLYLQANWKSKQSWKWL